jgi:hypothetical protein
VPVLVLFALASESSLSFRLLVVDLSVMLLLSIVSESGYTSADVDSGLKGMVMTAAR